MAEERTILLKVELDVDQLKKAQADAAKRVDAFTEKRKELKNATEQDTIAIAENNAELSKARKELNATTKAIKAQEEAQNNTTGSVVQMREQMQAANQIYNAMSADMRESEGGKALAAQMADLKTKINEAREEVNDFTGNVGNYENSMRKALEAVKETEKEITQVGFKYNQAKEEVKDNTKAMADLEKQMKANTPEYDNLKDKNESLNSSMDHQARQLSSLSEKLAEQKDEYRKIGFVQNETLKSNSDLTASFEDVYGDGVKPLTTQIGELEDRMYQSIAAGEGVGEEFDSMLNEAARLRKVILQTDAAVDQLAESGGLLGGAMSIGEGVVQGYQTLLGVQTLLGNENEDMLEVLAKMQAAQSVLNGLEATNVALRQNAIRFTRLRTKAQQGLNLALGKGTKASKLLRGALIATGVGALIVGAGLLIEHWEDLTALFTKSNKSLEANRDAMLAANEAIADQLSAADKLTKQLNDENLSREEKTLRIQELQAEYPDLLANIDAETDSIEDINKALELNIQLLRLRAKQEAIAESRAETYKAVLDEQVDAMTGANVGFSDQLKSQLDWDSVLASSLGPIGSYANAQRDATQAQKIANKETEKSIKAHENKLKILDELDAEVQKEMDALLDRGAVGKKENDEEKERQDELNKARDKWAKEEEARIKKAIALANQLREAQLNATNLTIDQQRRSLDAHYDFLTVAAKNNVDQLLQIEKDKAADMDALNQQELESEKLKLREKYAAQIEAGQENAELTKQLEQNLQLELEALDQEYSNNKALRDQELANRERQLNESRKESAQRAADEIALIDKEMQLERLKGSQQEFRAWQELQAERIRQVQVNRDRELAIETQTEQEREAIRKRAEQQIQSINLESFQQQKQLNEQEKQENRELALFIVQAAQQLSDTLFQIDSNRIQQEINSNKQGYDEQSQLLQDQLNAQLITQAEFNAQKSQLDAEFDAKQSELKKEQWEKQRAADIIGATIATALAVTRALATPPPASFILAGIAGTLGATQIGVIASQPTPEFEDGGALNLSKSGMFGGKRHSNGGTKGYFEDGTRVEVEKDEIFAIFNRKASAALAAASSHNEAHGGRSFYENGGVLKFQGGGAFAQNISQPIQNRYQQRNDLEQILRSMPSPIVDVKDINREQSNKVNVENRASF